MRIAVLVFLAALVACDGGSKTAPGTSLPRKPGVRITMEALHRTGGVPPGWRLSPPPGEVEAGRAAFADLGCHSCHKVAGEAFSAKESATGVGPELTGMGLHHPPAYFAEAILNPDAVLVEGPGYIGPDGHSVMPDYPELTTRQLGDLVAYLSSLKTGDPHAGHVMGDPTPTNLGPRPAAPAHEAKAFFVQSYDVNPGQLAAFEAWFEDGGRPQFQSQGALTIDTYVDYTRPEKRFTTILGFRDLDALGAFTRDPAALKTGLEFDGFIGDHGHLNMSLLPLYRVPTLSSP